MSSISTKLHFPARLYQVIETEDPSIIAWELSGKSFRIVDSKRFRAETIPKYFRHGNMASIQRQLNLYGFRCTNRIDEKGVFFHPNFIRGQYDTVRNIRRKKTWPTKRKPKVDPNAETTAVDPSDAAPTSSPGTENDTSLYGKSVSSMNQDCCASPLNGGMSPMSQMLSSDDCLLDFFDEKVIDQILCYPDAHQDSDFDQCIFKMFAADDKSLDILC